MATNAGSINTTAAAPATAQWVPCDGKPFYVNDPKVSARPHSGISEGTRQDYLRRVGWWGRRRGLGPSGWIICMPVKAAFSVSLADDSGDASTPPNSVQVPPAGTS